MDVMLRNEFEKYKLPFELGMNSKFWQGVLDDCSRADCLLVNSDFVKNTMVEQGYEEKKIKVVYLGVREDFFSLKSNYDINEKTKILFTGSFGFRKGGEYLLMAMMELDRLNFKYEMIVVGNYLGAESLIEKYKSKNIRYVGHVLQDELKKYLEESDIYLFPSLAEGCASSGMEAMAAGLPVVVTAESGLPINDGENGVIVSAKDSDAIVDAIIALKKDKSLRERLGKSASQTIINNFTWENYALKVLDAYHELL
jgi:glycosyltransferase involved in cell wall biosynthesis